MMKTEQRVRGVSEKKTLAVAARSVSRSRVRRRESSRSTGGRVAQRNRRSLIDEELARRKNGAAVPARDVRRPAAPPALQEVPQRRCGRARDDVREGIHGSRGADARAQVLGQRFLSTAAASEQ